MRKSAKFREVGAGCVLGTRVMVSLLLVTSAVPSPAVVVNDVGVGVVADLYVSPPPVVPGVLLSSVTTGDAGPVVAASPHMSLPPIVSAAPSLAVVIGDIGDVSAVGVAEVTPLPMMSAVSSPAACGLRVGKKLLQALKAVVRVYLLQKLRHC